MLEKAGVAETVKATARRDLDGMAKPDWLNPSTYSVKGPASEMTVDIRWPIEVWRLRTITTEHTLLNRQDGNEPSQSCVRGACSHPRNVNRARNAGMPKAREGYGIGVVVVAQRLE